MGGVVLRTRRRPRGRSHVVVELELVGVRAHAHGHDLVLALVVDPRRNEIGGEDVDHDYLTEGDVFTPDLIATWIAYKHENEIVPMRMRPHPYEFELYYDM